MTARPRAQRPRLPETSQGQRAARHAWNGGLTGKTRTGAEVAPYTWCTAPGCGSEATTGQPPAAGMVQVAAAGDGAGARWWCPGRCAVLARTRAELRAIPMRTTGGGR
ncbi:hypothetical protein ACFXAZ_38050 [Streptomyces sp. NPDC059477]|uniref:hypothetical protein n=1 Tax=Streptomyces sp. NPDC059477 TaxID=3346847 RepID=UPI00368F0F30